MKLKNKEILETTWEMENDIYHQISFNIPDSLYFLTRTGVEIPINRQVRWQLQDSFLFNK